MSRTLLGPGILAWNRSERTTNRYGSIYLHHNKRRIKLIKPARTEGRLLARIIGVKPTGDSGDWRNGIPPARRRSPPSSGQEIYLTEKGTIKLVDDMLHFMPSDHRQSLRMNPRALWQCRHHLIELYIEYDSHSYMNDIRGYFDLTAVTNAIDQLRQAEAGRAQAAFDTPAPEIDETGDRLTRTLKCPRCRSKVRTFNAPFPGGVAICPVCFSRWTPIPEPPNRSDLWGLLVGLTVPITLAIAVACYSIATSQQIKEAGILPENAREAAPGLRNLSRQLQEEREEDESRPSLASPRQNIAANGPPRDRLFVVRPLTDQEKQQNDLQKEQMAQRAFPIDLEMGQVPEKKPDKLTKRSTQRPRRRRTPFEKLIEIK
jgi:hypothetical protein